LLNNYFNLIYYYLEKILSEITDINAE